MSLVTTEKLSLVSSAFENNGYVPVKYSCEGENINPPLHINHYPQETQSLVLIMEDPDAPTGVWDHWVVWNITPCRDIAENKIPGLQGYNSFHQYHYGGPCPSSGMHRYFFKIFALDTVLDIPPKSRKSVLEKAMDGHILARGELTALYE